MRGKTLLASALFTLVLMSFFFLFEKADAQTRRKNIGKKMDFVEQIAVFSYTLGSTLHSEDACRTHLDYLRLRDSKDPFDFLEEKAISGRWAANKACDAGILDYRINKFQPDERKEQIAKEWLNLYYESVDYKDEIILSYKRGKEQTDISYCDDGASIVVLGDLKIKENQIDKFNELYIKACKLGFEDSLSKKKRWPKLLEQVDEMVFEIKK